MQEPDVTPVPWIERIISWSRRALLTRERLVLLGLLIGMGLVIRFRGDMPLAVQIGAWALLLVALAISLRTGWLRFFGPVFFYDSVRSARRSNFGILRAVYAGALLVVLFLVYSGTVQTGSSTFWESLWRPGTVQYKDIAKFGEAFFYVFVAVQFAAVMLLTPVCAAGAITEEKERRTLEYLLATDLGDREIVLGKLASRLAYLVLFMLTGLPVLSFLQFMGGVSPNLVVAAFIMTGLTMMSLAGLSVAVSVFATRTRGAVFLTYLLAASYLLVSSCCCALPLDWLTAGNFVIAVRRVFGSPSGVEDNLLGVFIEYSIFHVLAFTGCCLWAIVNLRVRSEKRPAGVTVTVSGPVPASRRIERSSPAWGPDEMARARRRVMVYQQSDPPLRPRPRVGDQPILWKELYAEPLLRLGQGGQTLVMVFGVMGLLMGGYTLLLSLAAAVSSGAVDVFTNGLARYFGSGLACLMLMGVAVRAAGTFTSERDRQTLDSLLMTTLANRDILFGKWLGSILGVRKGWLVLGPIYSLALFAGGLHPLALPALLAAWFIYAAFLAGLGMCLSMICRNTLIASVATVLTAVVLCGAHWGLWHLFLMAMYRPGQVPQEIQWVQNFLLAGLTLPVTLGALSFQASDFVTMRFRIPTRELVGYALVGVCCYALGAAVLWRLLSKRFGPVTGRMPLPRLSEAEVGQAF